MIIRIEMIRMFRIWDYLFSTVWIMLLVIFGAVNNIWAWNFTINIVPYSWLEPICILPPIIIISVIWENLKQKTITVLQIIAVVIILLVLLEIGLIIFFKIIEYQVNVAQSLNITPNLLQNSSIVIRVLIIFLFLFNS
jgi:hypothetical protein